MIHFKSIYIFLLILNAQCILLTNGFIAKTKVKTPTGYSFIENIKVNDEVICHDFNTVHLGKNKNPLAYCYSTSKVTNIFKFKVNRYVKVTINNEIVCTTIDQKFYLPILKTWENAKNKKMLNQLCLSYNKKLLPINNIELINEEVEIYDITVDKYHNYCIYPFDVTVHNIVPVLVITWTFAEIPIFIEFASVSVGLIAAGAAAGLAYIRNKNSKNNGTTYFYTNPDTSSPFNLSFSIDQLLEIQSRDSYQNPEGHAQISPISQYPYITNINGLNGQINNNLAADLHESNIISQLARRINADENELPNLSLEDLLKKTDNISLKELNALSNKKHKNEEKANKDAFLRLLKATQEKKNSPNLKGPKDPKDNKDLLKNAAKTAAITKAVKKAKNKNRSNNNSSQNNRNHHTAIRFTNKQDRIAAAELGYRESSNHPFDSHGCLTFTNGKNWITQDQTSHKGERWKMVDNYGIRQGTFDETLKIMIGH